MIPSEELRHLSAGARVDETPGGVGLVEVTAHTVGDADEVVRRCRDVLGIVLEAPVEQWSDEAGWSARLPPWFVEGSAPEQTAEEADAWLAWWRGLDGPARARVAHEEPWAISEWVYWLHPDERQWYWWDAATRGPSEIVVIIEVSGWPAPLGALIWLLRVAGADLVEVPE